MRGRHRSAAILATMVLASVAGCGGGQAQVFHPAGAPPRAAPATLTVRTAPGGFRFPPTVSIQFGAPLPGNHVERTVVAGYQDYVLSLWAAVLSHGKDTAYLRQIGGNALAFTQREIHYYATQHRTIQGVIRYFNTSVTAVYFGNGANVTSCVDTSGFRTTDTRTGSTTGPVFPRRLTHYLEDVTEGRRANGTWFVSRTQSFPASTSEGAACR